MTPAEIADAIVNIETVIEVQNIAGDISYGYHWHDTSVRNKVVFDEKQTNIKNRIVSSVPQGCYAKPLYHVHSASSTTALSYSTNVASDHVDGSVGTGCYTNVWRCTGTIHCEEFDPPNGLGGYEFWCDTCDSGSSWPYHDKYNERQGSRCKKSKSYAACGKSQSVPEQMELNCGWNNNQIAECQIAFPNE